MRREVVALEVVALFVLRVELVESALEVVELLAGFREFALRGKALVIVKVARCLRDESSIICRRGSCVCRC